MYNCFKALSTDIAFNVLYVYRYIYFILFYIMYNIHIVKRFRAHCGFYAIENKLLLLPLLLFETYANVSSQICPFLALRPEFHSNHCVNSSTPRYCQSATFGRLTFCVYTLCVFTEFAFNVATPTAPTPRPPFKPLCGKSGLHAES